MSCFQKIVLWFVFAVFVASPPVLAQSIAINEVMASNVTVIADEDGDYEDGIELYNFGTKPISLKGYGLSDNLNNPFRWIFPDVIVTPGDFVLVWASGKNRTNPSMPLHANFSIKANGETVSLTHPSGKKIDAIRPIVIPTDISYGRWPNGTGNRFFFNNPTPGASNSTQTDTEILSTPSFSRSGGFYSKSFDLRITHADKGATVIYTLDGSLPDPNNLEGTSYPYKNCYPENPGQPLGDTLFNSYRSHLYSSPVPIYDRSAEPDRLTQISATWHYSPGYFPETPVRKGVVVRARAFKPGAIASPIETHTYFISSGSNISRLPVIAISLQEDALFDYNDGIYVAGVDFDTWRRKNPDAVITLGTPANYHRRGVEWEYPAHIELFPAGASMAALKQDMGMRIHGDLSRALRPKSLRLYARKIYGQSDFEYPFFSDMPYKIYKRLILRNSGQDSYLTFLCDASIQAIVSRLNFDTQAYQPAVVFINSEYWGIHNIRELYGKHYLAGKYGIDEENIDLLEGNAEPQEGDASHYISMLEHIRKNDLSIEQNYEYIWTQMDIENFIDYQIAQIFVANTDWPGNNIKYWRLKTDSYNPKRPYGCDGRWRWLMYDTDYGFGGCGRPNAYEHNTLAWATATDGTDWPNPPWSTFLLRQLLRNESFKIAFINRFADLLNTTFLPARMIGIINRLKKNIEPEMPEHVCRWGSPSNWNSNVEVLINFANKRAFYQRRHIYDYFDVEKELRIKLDVSNYDHGHVRINTVEIKNGTSGIEGDPYPWTGVYFSSIPIKLEAIPAPGYAFSHWEGIEGAKGIVASVTPAGDLYVKAHFKRSNELKLVHYWHFNNLPNGILTSVAADFSNVGAATITYPGTGKGYMDSRAHRAQDAVSNLNLRMGQRPDQGDVLRVRNPVNTRELIIDADMSGYKDVHLMYAVSRTSLGATGHQLFFSNDTGQSWNLVAEYRLPELPVWDLKKFDLSKFPQLNNWANL